MKSRFVVLMTLSVLNPLILPAQNTSRGDQENDPRKEITITGCVTKNSHKEFELVDEKGIDNMLYGDIIPLDQYVGKVVTLVGKRSATPSTDMGIKNPQPHFLVTKVKSELNTCKSD